MLNKKCFTMMELLVVIVIIGILSALAFPNFGLNKERALDKEAKANLGFIQEAEKYYKMESGSYYPVSGNTNVAADINTNLKISIPTAAASWTYAVDTDNSQATASRLPAASRVWTLTYTGSAATCTGTGCPP